MEEIKKDTFDNIYKKQVVNIPPKETNTNNKVLFKNNNQINNNFDTNNMLVVQGLTKVFKGKHRFKALDNVSFTIKKGAICGFVGPNGAGKTTTIKSILGLIKAQGNVLINGKPNYLMETKEIIGYMPEKDAFYDDMTPIDYLLYLANLSGLDKNLAKNRAEKIINMLGLTDAKNRKIGGFSSGMKKKVLFAQAIIHMPKFIVLDEPTANLDPIAQEQLIDILKEMAKGGSTIFISSHHISELERIVDYVIIIKKGHILLEKEIEEINADNINKIEITLDSVDLAQRLLPFLKRELIRVYLENNHIYVSSKNPNEDLKIVKRIIDDRAITVENIKIKKAGLWDYVLQVLERDENE